MGIDLLAAAWDERNGDGRRDVVVRVRLILLRHAAWQFRPRGEAATRAETTRPVSQIGGPDAATAGGV